MTCDVMTELYSKARAKPQRAVLPEATEENILLAARQLLDQGLALPLLVGRREEVAEAAAGLGLDLSDIEVIDGADDSTRARLIDERGSAVAGMSPKGLDRRLRTPLNLGAFLVAAGRANILVFPDLSAGNIACRAVQRFAKADAFGPFLPGFAKTVCDLSRGATVANIVGAGVMACVHAQGDSTGAQAS